MVAILNNGRFRDFTFSQAIVGFGKMNNGFNFFFNYVRAIKEYFGLSYN